jgi:pimeloyl-ACP methyl ester carboxylesterase
LDNHFSSKLCAVGLLMMVGLTGCSADDPLNPSFPLTLKDARLALKEMADDPKPLDRPVIVLGGIYDPGVASSMVADRIRSLVSDDDDVLSISFFGLGTFDRCRDRVIQRLQDAFPNDDPDHTIEVDVVAISMGGLVARHAAIAGVDGHPQLRVQRLFTVSTPHRGANMAKWPTFDRRAIDMRAQSSFLASLESDLETAQYEILPYVRLGDVVVGESNAAPPGRHPWWVRNIPGSMAHMFSMFDARLLADIARRLRGEASYSTIPAAALPGSPPHGVVPTD